MVVFFAVLAALWQGAHELVGAEGLSSPLATFARAGALLGSANFWTHAGATGLAFAYALAVALAGGLATGLPLGYFRLAGDVFEPVVGSVSF